MGNIISIEPLKPEWINSIEKKIGEKIHLIHKNELDENGCLIADSEVLICRDRDLSEGLLMKFPALKFIFVVSAGVEKLPFDYLQQNGIVVANTSGVSDAVLSDYVIGAMLMYSSKFFDCFRYKQENYWKPYLMSEGLFGKELVIVGAGKVGRAVAAKATAFGMRVVGIKSQVTEESLFNVIDVLDNLDSYLATADYVACTLPLTKETYHLFTEEKFSIMKESAVFINVSRGKLVDEQGLISSLKANSIKGAVLDVFEEEPLNSESELWSLENVIISPHSSGRIAEFLKYSMGVFEKNLLAFRNKEKLPNQVDLEKGY